jgi:hypothetical protein
MDRHDLESSGTQCGQEEAAVNTGMKLLVSQYEGNFLTTWGTISFSSWLTSCSTASQSVTQSKPVAQWDLKSPTPKYKTVIQGVSNKPQNTHQLRFKTAYSHMMQIKSPNQKLKFILSGHTEFIPKINFFWDVTLHHRVCSYWDLTLRHRVCGYWDVTVHHRVCSYWDVTLRHRVCGYWDVTLHHRVCSNWHFEASWRIYLLLHPDDKGITILWNMRNYGHNAAPHSKGTESSTTQLREHQISNQFF